jgi:ribosomal protein S18 acetylase RimI-like enzyme
MIDPNVRPARADDGPELAMLEDAARAGLVDARGGARWLEEHPRIGPDWASAIARRDVFVAELADPVPVLAGYLVLDVEGAVATVDQVYVSPQARELGFGDALLASAWSRAAEAGAAILEGHALPGDRHIKNLYERAGITARLITVSRVINDPSSSADASR